jgi:E3 Ubiquitin ligase
MGQPYLLAFFASGQPNLIVWAAVGIAAGVYLFVRGFRMLQRKRLILNTPTSKIRSASMGLVEVSGLAVGPYVMTAPLTALPCYYYRSIAWQWKQQGKNKEWVKVADESLHLPFYLDDNTGRVLVNPQGAELDIHRDFHEEYSDSLFTTKEFAPPNVCSFLARHNIDTDTKIKVEEYCIKPKNALFVMGTLAENSGLEVGPKPIPTLPPTQGITLRVPGFGGNPPQSALEAIPGLATSRTSTAFTLSSKQEQIPTAPPQVVRLTTDSPRPEIAAEMTQQQKIAAALVKAGITSPAAWAAAGLPQASPVAVAAATAVDKGEEFDLHPTVVLMKGEHNPAFFISWRSQKDVVASLGWKSALLIWGGPALSLLCVYLLLTRLNLL